MKTFLELYNETVDPDEGLTQNVETNSIVYRDKNNVAHRVNGPAVIFTPGVSSGVKWWIQHGKFHRLDGPAIERPSGHNEWWIKGKSYISKDEFSRAIAHLKQVPAEDRQSASDALDV